MVYPQASPITLTPRQQLILEQIVRRSTSCQGLVKGAKVVNIHQRIVDSVIGQRALLAAAPRRLKALRFMIGDDCHIELM